MRAHDLVPWNYGVGNDRPVLGGGALAFGETDVPESEPDPTFLTRLETVCRRPIQPCRSHHMCSVCGKRYEDYAQVHCYAESGVHAYEGNADILVRARSGIVYQAPIQIVHYVRDHHYLPPREFIEAVVDGPDEDMSWYAEE